MLILLQVSLKCTFFPFELNLIVQGFLGGLDVEIEVIYLGIK